MAPPVPKPKVSAGNPLTRKLGPLPAWAWLLIVVGGFLAYRRLHGGQANDVSAPTFSGGAVGPAGTGSSVVSGDESGGGGLSSLEQALEAQQATIDQLTGRLTQTPAEVAAPTSQGAPQGAAAQSGPASSPAPAPAPAAATVVTSYPESRPSTNISSQVLPT